MTRFLVDQYTKNENGEWELVSVISPPGGYESLEEATRFIRSIDPGVQPEPGSLGTDMDWFSGSKKVSYSIRTSQLLNE